MNKFLSINQTEVIATISNLQVPVPLLVRQVSV